MKNSFCLILKALYVRKIFKLLSWHLDHVEKPLAWKIRLVSTFMTSQTGWKTIVIHRFHKISKGKGNLAIIFGQLKWYNMWNIFMEKSYTTNGKNTCCRPFYKK